MKDNIFKSYDIRGIYPEELNEQDVQQIAQAYLTMLSEKLNKPIKKLKIVVCKDVRGSSGLLLEEAIKVFLEYGVQVDDYDFISINGYYFAAGYYKYDGGLMATASHNPPEYGGFKMVIKNTEYSDSIEFISGKELLDRLKKIDFPIKDEKIKGGRETKELRHEHLKHIFSFVQQEKFKPFKVVVDTGNGMNGLLIPKIFEKTPCELINMFPDPDGSFPNRNPNPLAPGAADKISQRVVAEGADMGFIFDVDGDRMFMVDEKGQFIRGDMILPLMAKPMLERFPGQGIAYNLICSHTVPELIRKWGGKPIRSEVGYLNLARHMREEGGVMSGEVSGHFAFRDNYYADSAFIAMLLVLQQLTEDGRKLSEIIKENTFYSRGDEINIKVDDIPAKLDKIRQTYSANILDEIDGITVEFDDWWFNVRASNTEPLLRVTVEASNEDKLKARQQEILNLINN
ncbi:phosphomannomutase/phosphoglucomutase [Candidatus Parcubacteria bacterium]|jgi:phosphomannomutase|nr:phosphomannomutase/phosphoglucomutase [Candidatus Parcubacteria bacterium]